MSHDEYSLSFTTGTLFIRESVQVADLYFDLSDWNTVRDAVISGDLLHARTLNTSKRVCREIISRLKTLTSDELKLLVRGTTQDQGYILWIAVCRRYTFIADFASEVIRECYLSLKNVLYYEDFDFFVAKKTEWHPELDRISFSTREKLRQVLFKMLREANIISKENAIIPAVLSTELLEVINTDHQNMLLFPSFDSEIRKQVL